MHQITCQICIAVLLDQLKASNQKCKAQTQSRTISHTQSSWDSSCMSAHREETADKMGKYFHFRVPLVMYSNMINLKNTFSLKLLLSSQALRL